MVRKRSSLFMTPMEPVLCPLASDCACTEFAHPMQGQTTMAAGVGGKLRPGIATRVKFFKQ